jgi:hypothetical protein
MTLCGSGTKTAPTPAVAELFLIMLPPPANIVPLDPDEFSSAYQYGVMVTKYEFLEEIPRIGKTFLATDSSLLALPSIPENRFLLAVERHFRNEAEKFLSFMLRFLALRRLFKHPLMKKYIRETGDEREFHCAVFEVAATHQLSDNYVFTSAPFFEEVRRVAALMDEGLPPEAAAG